MVYYTPALCASQVHPLLFEPLYVVLVNSIKPANIIMAVSYNVDIEDVLHPLGTAAVPTLAVGQVDQQAHEKYQPQVEKHCRL